MLRSLLRGPHLTFIRLAWIVGLLTFSSLSLLSPWHSTQAQTATEQAPLVASPTTNIVGYDNPVAGLITDDAPESTWILNAPFRDRIAISVDRANDTLVPNIELLDPDGKSIAHADHDATAAHTGIKNIKLDRAVAYSIVVRRDKGKDGKTHGNFILLVSLLGSGPENPDLFKRTAEPIRQNRPQDGEITNAKWLDVTAWSPVSTDHVQLVVTRMSGTLMPTIVLVGPDNKEVAHADPDATGAKAQLDFVVPAPAQYEIRVGRVGNENGATSGKYRLVETILGLGADNSGFTVIQGNVDLGTPRKGNLVGRQWQNTWAFTVDNPIAITITMTRDSGTLIPLLTLSDANHKQLAVAQADETWATATISKFQLPAAGQYFVTAGRADGTSGLTTGDYEFTITEAK